MPTGYTAKLIEKGQSFPEFVMLCARAFGACVEMREDGLDAPIPDKFEPSDYHVKARTKAMDAFAFLNQLDDSEKIAYGKARKQSEHDSIMSCIRERSIEAERIDNMKAEVEEWEPPTEEHDVRKIEDDLVDYEIVARHCYKQAEAMIAEKRRREKV